MAEKVSKAEQSDRTRTALLTAARELFTTQGYANTTTEEIVRRAGVTKSTIYYYFADKASLFQAVFIEVENAMQRTIAQSVMEAEGDIWQRIQAGSSTFFRLCLEPSIQRILYVDGPAVLNKDSWQSGGAEGGINVVRQNLQLFMEQGYIEEYPLEALTHIWFGVYAEAALYIARAENKETALAEVEHCVEKLANGLRLQAQVAAAGAPSQDVG